MVFDEYGCASCRGDAMLSTPSSRPGTGQALVLKVWMEVNVSWQTSGRFRTMTGEAVAALRESGHATRPAGVLRLLPSIDRRLTMACLVLAVLQAGAGVGLVLAIGNAVGSILEAVAAGPGSPRSNG